MASAKKRVRSANFSSAEKEVILELVAKYKNVIENKSTDGMSVAEKAAGWERIANEFNSVSSTHARLPSNLKSFWDNWKKNARKAASETKLELLKTGNFT